MSSFREKIFPPNLPNVPRRQVFDCVNLLIYIKQYMQIDAVTLDTVHQRAMRTVDARKIISRWNRGGRVVYSIRRANSIRHGRFKRPNVALCDIR